jgi:hypothetical protein
MHMLPLACASLEQVWITAHVLHRGGLHWDLGRGQPNDQQYTVMHAILVFDTAAEKFRWLRRPSQAARGPWTFLLEMGGALTLFSTRNSDEIAGLSGDV